MKKLTFEELRSQVPTPSEGTFVLPLGTPSPTCPTGPLDEPYVIVELLCVTDCLMQYACLSPSGDGRVFLRHEFVTISEERAKSLIGEIPDPAATTTPQVAATPKPAVTPRRRRPKPQPRP